MQLLSRRHGRTELQQLQWHGVLQVDLRGLTAAEAAQEAQALSCPLPGGHDGCGNQVAVAVQVQEDRGRGQGAGRGSGAEDEAAI